MRRTRITMFLIRSVIAVVVTVTAPRMRHTFVIRTLELVIGAQSHVMRASTIRQRHP